MNANNLPDCNHTVSRSISHHINKHIITIESHFLVVIEAEPIFNLSENARRGIGLLGQIPLTPLLGCSLI